jgi:RecB family exonuclease
MLKKIIVWITGRFRPGVEVSYSRINAYLTCPWKYRLMYREGKRIPPNPFISLGISVHRALEDFHRRKATSLEELMESYDRSWVNEGFASPQQTQEFYEKGQRMLEVYHRASTACTAEIQHLEKEFEIHIGRHRLKGIIDRIDRHPDGTYEIIDYKTHGEAWKQEKVDSDLQLSIYSLACSRALGIEPKLLSYYFLAHDRKMSTRRSAQQIAETIGLINKVAEKIGRDEFVPNKTHCPRCDFKKICPHSAAR